MNDQGKGKSSTRGGRSTAARTFIWAKIIVLLALLAYIIAFVLINSDHQAVVWLVPTVERSVPTLWVILLTALLVVLTDVVGRRLWRSVKQLRRRG